MVIIGVINMPHPTGPTNERTRKLAIEFRKKKEKLYLDIARNLVKPRRSKKPINLNRLQKLSSKYDNFVIPGKVLGIGDISKPVNVYALSFSKEAKAKIEKAGGKAFSLNELLRDDTGNKARIVI